MQNKQIKRKFSHLNTFLTIAVVALTISIAFMSFANTRQADSLAEYEEKLNLYPADAKHINEKIEKTTAQTEDLTSIFAIHDKIQKVSGGRIDTERALHYSLIIAEESERYDIDPMLILAIIAAESSFRRDVVSHKGARGLMQLLPSTAFYISKKTEHLNITDPEELFDEETNLRLGVAYLAYLLKKTGSTEHAVIAYNYGPANLRRAITSNATLPKKYVRTVMNYYKKITQDSNG